MLNSDWPWMGCWECRRPVGDDDGVFDVMWQHVAAPVGSVLVIFDEYIHGVL